MLADVKMEHGGRTVKSRAIALITGRATRIMELAFAKAVLPDRRVKKLVQMDVMESDAWRLVQNAKTTKLATNKMVLVKLVLLV